MLKGWRNLSAYLLYIVVYIFELQVPAHMYLYTIHIDIDIDAHIRSVQTEEL